ncbi:MAG: hypothetical protein ACE5KA_02645 [Nitrososphaerales archaeon]
MPSIMWLAHVNPVTKAHEEIIRERMQEGDVYVFPVIFRKKDGREVNTRSLPFSFEVRKEMLQSTFDSKIHILNAYTFNEPYKAYEGKTIAGLPITFSDKAHELRNNILSLVPEPRKSYTGNYSEYLLLKKFGLNPERHKRKSIAGTDVRDLMYKEALKQDGRDWRTLVSSSVADIIEKNWNTVLHFADKKDNTIRRVGLKIPADGYE